MASGSRPGETPGEWLARRRAEDERTLAEIARVDALPPAEKKRHFEDVWARSFGRSCANELTRTVHLAVELAFEGKDPALEVRAVVEDIARASAISGRGQNYDSTLRRLRRDRRTLRLRAQAGALSRTAASREIALWALVGLAILDPVAVADAHEAAAAFPACATRTLALKWLSDPLLGDPERTYRAALAAIRRRLPHAPALQTSAGVLKQLGRPKGTISTTGRAALLLTFLIGKRGVGSTWTVERAREAARSAGALAKGGVLADFRGRKQFSDAFSALERARYVSREALGSPIIYKLLKPAPA